MSKWNDFVAAQKPIQEQEMPAKRPEEWPWCGISDLLWADGIAKWREWSNMTCGCDDIQVEVDFYQGATEGDWCAHIQDRPGGYAYTCATAAELIRCLELDRLLNPDYWVGGTEKTLEDVRNFVASRPGEIPDRMFGLADSLGNVRPIP